jgi:hypothetical protein
METKAETVRAADAWYHADQERIAREAGMSVRDYRNKAESVRARIARDPVGYRNEFKSDKG